MKCVFYTRYGPPDVLQLREMDTPVPAANEILVKVHATSVNRTDNATTKAIPSFARIVTGLFRPKRRVPGTEFAGEVVAVGEGVTTLSIGDRVFGFEDLGCGAQAEFLTIQADHALTIPGGISYEQAAVSSEGAHYALNFINKVAIEPGQDVLVYGASGAIGSAMVQLLKSLDVNVTAVCGTRNVELVRSLGADRVVDYTREDIASDPQRYDYVFDAAGKISFFRCRQLLKPNGVYMSSDLGFLAQNIYLPLLTPVLKPLWNGKTTRFPVPRDIPATLAVVRRLMEQGRFRAVIDRRYPLERVVEAYRYVEQGHKTGNVVITVVADTRLPQ
jgi:NADPH:quinone reductase-like Zn-dependent oxidoreductase